MTSRSFERIRALFHEACELDSEARAAFLDGACAEDPDLRLEIEALLANDRDGCLPLSAATVPLGKRILRETAPDNRHPETIAGYRIIRRIGAGGMAEVFEAEQNLPRRTVAIKLIRRRAQSEEIRRRFVHEAQILGLLHHPGIAQIFEAGIAETPDGPQMFVAMELIRGRPLTEFATEQHLDVRERLELAARVCDAIQHAHQKGVIHRDIKPANILVEGGNPKVLDFGVARVTDVDLHLTHVETNVGQLIGTLPYMSPEQVSGDPAEIDTRCDVYALGVLLFELLTGQLPHDFHQRSVPDLARAIRHDVAPLVGTLNRALRGEIETIVSRAIDKDKTRRYGSAAELASDLRRYLEGLPIEARRDSVLYVLRKRIHRYRGTAIVAAVLSALALTSAGVALVQSSRNHRLALDEAAALADSEREKQRADLAVQDLTLELRANHIERGRLLGLTGDCRTAEDLLWGEYLGWPDCTAAYWGLWELYSRCPLAASLPGHATLIRALAVSPDRLWIASGGGDGGIFLWDARSYARRCVQEPNGKEVRALTFSADSARIIAGDSGGRLTVWDCQSGRTISEAHAHEGGAHGISLVDDNTVATAGADGFARLWKLLPLAQIDERKLSDEALNALAVDARATRLLAAGDDSAIHAVDLVSSPKGEVFGTSQADLRGHEGQIMSLVYSPDGSRVASGGRDRVLRLWRMPSGELEAALRPANGSLRALAFSADGRTLAEAGWWTTDLWDLASDQRLFSVPMHAATWTLAWLGPDALALGDFNLGPSNIRIWESQPRRCLRRISAHPERARTVSASPDGRLAATGGADGLIRLWDIERGTLEREFKSHDGATRVRFSSDSRMIATVGDEGYLEAWEASDGRRIFGQAMHCGPNGPMCFLPGTHRVLMGRADGQCLLWDLDAGQLVSQWDNGSTEVVSVHVLPDSGLIVTAARNLPLKLWSIQDHEPRGELNMPAGTSPWTLGVSSYDERIAAGSWGQRVVVWDSATRAIVANMAGHTQLITGVAFGAKQTGDLIASCSTDGLIKLWDWRSSTCLATLDAGGGSIADLTFAPDGGKILAAYGDGTLGIWDLTYYARHIEGNRAVHVLHQEP